ncbi:MAG: glycosyltransferase family 4 protein [Proteobacteria bacterium]|nr:glycosyltransferase family 4 protein [Pseudomonadota bacterium]
MTVYVDCTSTREAFNQTGIQRVVRNIIRHAPEAARQHDVAIVPVFLANRTFHVAECTPGSDLVIVPAPDPASLAGDPLKELYWRVMRGVARHVRSTSLRKWLLAPAARDGLARALSHAAHAMRLRTSVQWTKVVAPLVRFTPGDVLIALDLDMKQGVGVAIGQARAAGARIVCVCYDLIPLSHPDGLPPEFLDAFHDWMDCVLMEADDVITISEAVANDVRAFFAAAPRPPRARTVQAFRLGHEMDVVADDVRPEVRSQFVKVEGQPVFLTVGWIDVRKNQKTVVEALGIVAEAGFEARLVMYGKRGPTTAAVLDWMRQRPDLAARVEIRHDATDAEIDHAYRHCTAVICPSLTEGFGLPLLEALARGASVFASDIPVFHEVAGDQATYFDPRRPADLAACLISFLEHPREPARPAVAAAWPGWRESARAFFELALRERAA